MKKIISYLLLVPLLSVVVFPSFAQQNENALQQEIESLKKQLSEIQKQLKTVENVEKMELAAKLADANAKLRNAEIDKYKRELKDANNEWLRTWSLWFVGILGFFIAILLGVSTVFWYWLKSRADKLIANEVEKSLNGFKESVEQVKIQQDRIRILEKEHAATVIDDILFYSPGVTYPYPERINAISDMALLDVFNDEKRRIVCRSKAAEFLTDRKSKQIVPPLIVFLNTILDSDSYNEVEPLSQAGFALRKLVNYLGMIHNPEIYKELTKFLNRLLRENTELKDMFLTWTVFSLADVGDALNTGSSISNMKEAIPDLALFQREREAIENLVNYFDKFDEHEGIKEIYNIHVKGKMSELADRCLDLLEKYDPDFVREQREEKAANNAESEDS